MGTFISYRAFSLIMTKESDLAEYETYLAAKGVKDRRMSYLRRLRAAYGKPLIELSAMEINGWMAGLTIAPKTHQAVVSYVRNALKYLNGGEVPSVSKQIASRKGAAKLISRVKDPAELLTDAEVEGLISATPRADMKALLALHRATGARTEELLRLRWENITSGHRDGKDYLNVSIRDTKTGIPRVVFAAKPLALRYLKEWKNTGNGTGSLWTFRGARTYWKYLKRLALKAGIAPAKNVYPRLFRHTRATEIFDWPSDVRDAQMGWVPGSNMHAQYTHLRPEASLEIVLERDAGSVVETPSEELQRRFDEIVAMIQDHRELGVSVEHLIDFEGTVKRGEKSTELQPVARRTRLTRED